MIDIYKNKPPKNNYIPLKRYQNVVFIKKYNIDIVESFFKKFPEEKRGRRKFKEKEILNQKALIYEEIFQKALKIKSICIGSIKEQVSKDIIKITVSFFKKMNENRILFVDLDGTLIKEDLSDLAFVNSLKTNPLKLIFYLIVFFFKGKSYLKEKISKNYIVPIEKLNFNNAALDYIKDVKNRHRVVYLISGSHQLLVDQIDKHLRIFFESFGTNIDFNMVGKNKVDFINNELKILEFDYLGNSKQDLPIWEYTKKIIFTNVSKDLREIINSSKLDKFEIKENFQK